LEELYLNENALSELENIENLSITTLDLSYNKLVTLKGIESLTKLQELWVNLIIQL
jgi:protein phosphatase 1 regulatory subunit 7